jgi:hypothetical protein
MAAAGDEHPTVFPERPLLADIVDLARLRGFAGETADFEIF